MESLEKAIRALILIQIRGISTPEQVKLLASAGFKPTEIGEMLGVKANTASKVLERERKGGKSDKAAKTK